jgi:hypothetical protein
MDQTEPSAVYVGDVSCTGDVEAGGLLCKTWKFRNSGMCRWPAGTLIQQVSGDFVGASHVLNVESLPEAGEEVEVTLSSKVPQVEGRQVGYFQLVTPEGKAFGHKVWIDVVVQVDMSPNERKIFDMGFGDLQAIRVALNVEGGDVEKAVECLLGPRSS